MSLDGKVLYIESINQGMLFGRVNGRWECVGSAGGEWDGKSAENVKKWLDEHGYVWRWVM